MFHVASFAKGYKILRYFSRFCKRDPKALTIIGRRGTFGTLETNNIDFLNRDHVRSVGPNCILSIIGQK